MWVHIVLAILTIAFLYIKWTHTYWKRKGVMHVEPTFLVGLMTCFLKGEPLLEPLIEVYKKARAKGERYIGHYEFLYPVFVPIDVELIKLIFQDNFMNFDSHGSLNISEEVDPFIVNLFHLRGEDWKNMRRKLSPTFSTGKIKMMFDGMVACGKNLEEYLKQYSQGKTLELKELSACFTTDIIGSIAFGIDVDSLKNPYAEFRQRSKEYLSVDPIKVLRLIVAHSLPTWLVYKLNFSTLTPKMTQYYTDLVRKTVQHREKNNIFRRDFLHLLIQLKNLGKVGDDGRIFDDTDPTKAPQMTISEMAAQCFVFYVAAFDTSANTISFALYELAQNREIQDRAREEIRRVLKHYDDELTYDALKEMEYLEQILSETLRKYPPGYNIPRVCSKDFKVPNSDLVIYKGQSVRIPAYCIHRDPEYYPNPEVFDPERFSEENKDKISPLAYLPFGGGPRTCFGARFGKVQTKVGLCSILKNHEVTLNNKTKMPLNYEAGFTLAAGEVWLDVKTVP
uniref:Cytochrome P450 n=1 Tax=Agasicles hygrophila TaxID=715812 RepID=A0A3Q8AWJ2_9CUCU|nr:cytochrome P450 [Agasicles hygrophila]